MANAADSTDIAIVGAGAAGLACAIFAGEAALQRDTNLRIVLLDGARKVGAKILVSGGGRCNVTHDRVSPDDYNGPRNIVRNILRAFDERATVRWFETLGVQLKREETGKLFPVTDSARTVLDALLRRCRELNVELLTDHRVRAVRRSEDCWHIDHTHGTLITRRLVLATGGRSLPRTGSDGAGWRFVAQLGHTVTPTYPALVPLVLQPTMFHMQLAGVSHEAELSTFADNKLIDRRTGSLLWTHFGISGPVVMDASRHWVIAHAEGRSPRLVVSFFPGETFESVERMLIESGQRQPRRPVVTLLAEHLPRRLAEVLCQHVGLQPGETLGQLPRDRRRTLVHALTALVLDVQQDRGWNYAEVTAGGVPLNEIDYRTMASRCAAGLYLVGEMLDCDGRIGGFNFQWAWATGHIAGRAAVVSLLQNF